MSKHGACGCRGQRGVTLTQFGTKWFVLTMAGKKGDDEGLGWRQFRWLPLLVVCGIIVGALLGSGRYLDWIKDWKESRIVRSLGLPDSLQGIAGLELPNIDFTLKDSEKRSQDIGSGYSIKSGTGWLYEHEVPKYEIVVVSMDFAPDLSSEKFNEIDEGWVSNLQVFGGFKGDLTFSGLTSSVYFHASDLLSQKECK